MTPGDLARVADIRAALNAFTGGIIPWDDIRWLLDRLAAETERADNLDATVAHYQGVLIATCAAKAEVQRREAELRARIEALCDEVESAPFRGRIFGGEPGPAILNTEQVRAALSPAEETP